jgi:hypothetical protein
MLKIPLRSHRVVLVVGAALAVALGFGGFVAVSAVPAGAATGVGTPTVTDDVQGTVTTPDDVVTCLPSTMSVGGTTAVTFPVGCLTLYYGDSVKVTWSGTGYSTDLSLSSDGNLVLSSNDGNTWDAGTTAADKSTGPGCEAPFQSDANLVVYNCASSPIWAAGTETHPEAFLAFQADGNLVIYNHVCVVVSSTLCVNEDDVLWATGTNSLPALGKRKRAFSAYI